MRSRRARRPRSGGRQRHGWRTVRAGACTAIDAKAAAPMLAATIRAGRGRGVGGGRRTAGWGAHSFGQCHELGGLAAAGSRSSHGGSRGVCRDAAAVAVEQRRSGGAWRCRGRARSRRSRHRGARAPRRASRTAPSGGCSWVAATTRVQPRGPRRTASTASAPARLGPTSRGKSTLLLNMTVEAISARGWAGSCSTRPTS